MLTHLRPALVLLALFVALTGIAYPLAMTGVAQVALSRQANGSLIERNGAVVGSDLIGQPFTSDRYFQPRPSATSAPDPKDPTKTVDTPYNAAGSGGSNLGPTAQKLVDRVSEDVGRLRKDVATGPLPADAVTTSASGLDPHISPAFAGLQIARVAKARSLPEQRVRTLVETQVEGRVLGFIGEPRVNVLRLNLALDALQP
ncbi:MAG TPA: potassium-transporting ATPase subunit KdpC [Xanthobacteraceae bacterium]|nr:potassium-transporting ATPase subunit KdpC [Xanthobacteraceae bacterium]